MRDYDVFAGLDVDHHSIVATFTILNQESKARKNTVGDRGKLVMLDSDGKRIAENHKPPRTSSRLTATSVAISDFGPSRPVQSCRFETKSSCFLPRPRWPARHGKYNQPTLRWRESQFFAFCAGAPWLQVTPREQVTTRPQHEGSNRSGKTSPDRYLGELSDGTGARICGPT